MKYTLIIILAAITIGGCHEATKSTAEDDMRRQTDSAMAEANAQIGMPAIKNFQERKLAKMIFELRDREKLVCYAYIVNKMQGKLVFIGKCMGFGLPYSVQYTPPQVVHLGEYNSMGMVVKPQADPNGLYMPAGLSATWLMMINPKTGDAQPVYLEPEIVVSPFPLHNMEK